MKNGILKILIIAFLSIFFIYISIFFFSPSSIVDIYRGGDEKSIWVKTKYFPFKKEISGTDSYKAPNIQWSPDKNYLVFLDFVREEIYNKEWFLKIINPRTLRVKTIFIGDYKTSEYYWIDNKTIRVYVSAGSGVRTYRDIDIDIREPFIAAEYTSPENWTPEKTFVNDFSNQLLKSAIIDTMNPYEKAYAKDIKIEYFNENNSLFLAIIEQEKDWFEDFKAGIYKNNEVEWLQIENPPAEQSILEARFLSLKGFSDPIVEVYGKTHAGHGAVYFYEVKNNQLSLLLKTQAVDSNNDISWAPDNYEKYGYGNCGEVFSSSKLSSSFEDLNNDGMSNIILTGTEEIICEKKISESLENLKTAEIKVASIPVNKVFLWNESKGSFFED